MTEDGCNFSSATSLAAVPDSNGANCEWDADTDLQRVHRLLSPVAPGLNLTELPVVRYKLLYLLQLIIPALKGRYDTTFLNDYCNVLQREDEAVIQTVTYQVMASVQQALRGAGAGAALGEQRAALGAWLSAAALAEAPRVRGARAALRQLLVHCTPGEREALASGWWRALPAGTLIALSDAVRAPRPGAQDAAPSLAELLLRGALCHLPPAAAVAPHWAAGAPRLEELAAGEPLSPERMALLGRVLAVAPPSLRAAPLHRLAAAKRAPRDADAPGAARTDRKAAVCKLQILFGAEDSILTPSKKRKRL